MPLPKAVRRRTPDALRHNRRLRALALGAGLIPPRTMHSPEEASLLAELASGQRTVVEIGVYEGSSALVLCRSMPSGADLHLIDPFVDETGWALPAGWGASAKATRRVVGRAGGPRLHWYVARSQDVGRDWPGPPVDVVFIDGDHSPEGVREDWDVWHPHVRPGGHVAFHDAREPGLGPTQVVAELFPREGWELTHEVDNVVVVTRDPRPGTRDPT
ncbi:MAG TPA: class I SAM-dependent methyltransferase [Thermoleophilaceae bacterium]|nr:class I SAM-dependent methyltransferase [Thermoleophilaceae bacterium]